MIRNVWRMMSGRGELVEPDQHDKTRIA